MYVPHCGSSLGSVGRCMPSLWEQFVLIVGAVWVVWVGVCPVGAVWVGVCPHCGSSLGRCMPSLWEQFVLIVGAVWVGVWVGVFG